MKSVSIGLFVLALTVFAGAQAPAPATAQSPDRLPVRRVVLYKSGVGYFEHLGRVRGNQTVTVAFTSGQLDDVLKSLTAIDLDGGRVAGVSYNSEAGLDRRLGALRLPVGPQTTRAEFLSALRGARLEVRQGTTRFIGRLLSVERLERRTDAGTVSIDTVSLVSDAGEVQTVALDPGVSVRIVEADLGEEVSKYLGLIASVRDQDVRRLNIATTGTGERDLFVSYVSEVPVWKATYRLVLPAASEARKPLLQGWAIVDNTVGEDWQNVQLSLVAGAPQSFVQAISRPYYVQRPVVPLPERVSLAPQTHQGAVSVAGAGVVTGTVTDNGGGAVPGATVSLSRAGAQVASVFTDGNGRYRVTGLSSGTYDVTVSLAGFESAEFRAVAVSGGMESVVNATLRLGSVNQSIVSGLPQGNMNVTVDGVFRAGAAGGGGGGRGGRGGAPPATPAPPPPPRLDAVEEVSVARYSQQVDAAAAQLGDLFEYKLKEPVTIPTNQSALVPILSNEVQADKVSLWNAASGTTRALRAVWLTNATGLTLDGGSFSVIEGQAFAGEGLIEPLKAGERRLLSYALDLGLVIDAKAEPIPTRIQKVQISRGVLIQQTEERRRHTYSARNDDAEPRTLVVEHPARAGWTVTGTVKPAESTPTWHRFRVTVDSKTTATFTVEDVRPVQSQISVSSLTDDHVMLFVRDQAISGPVEASLRQVLARKTDIARLNNELARRNNEIAQIGRDQERVRENMRSLKGSSEERQLLQRYVKQLDDQETRIETLRKEIETLTADRNKAQTELNAFIEKISV